MDGSLYQRVMDRLSRADNFDLIYALDHTLTALAAAEEKHPHWPRDRSRQALIVMEEAGELAQASLNVTEFLEQNPFGYKSAEDHKRANERYVDLRDKVEHEAAHTAAMALRLLMHAGRST